MKKMLAEFRSFYPHYIAAHSDRTNQLLHFTGATLFFLLLTIAFLTNHYWLIAVAIATGYLLPGIGHRFYQHNESFRSSKPVLCVLCAFRMYVESWKTILSGRKNLKANQGPW